ncbi:hypothetical protein Patl1_31515 [Pistacia atlantica]|uniref:Uncharacterized protein n=1 Tax=Pistacia atlantica TaxID=434234 RepID=A0ACC1AQF6_9ROSI|nr:hypothetical protein Patl1_31515 [Pistacia atlantica]
MVIKRRLFGSVRGRKEWTGHGNILALNYFRVLVRRWRMFPVDLMTIAEQLGQFFAEYLGKQSARRTQERQSTLSMYKYNQDIIDEQSSPSANVMNKLCDHVLSLHLPTKKCKYWMQSGPTPFSFNAGPDIIVVSVGKQLEEWSLGEFKCVVGEYIFQPTDPQTCFSIELKCSSLNIKQHFSRTLRTISIADQILIALILALLYSIFKFLWS